MNSEILLYSMAYQDRSDRVRWLLEEAQVSYKDIFLKKNQGDLVSVEYKKINPLGRVPTIVDKEIILFESAAICLYVADKYALGKLAPTYESNLRASYLQWMVWSVGTLESVVARMFTHVNTDSEKHETHTYVREQSKIFLQALNPILEKQDYILPSGFSAADIMLGSIIPGAWDDLVKTSPAVERYMEKLMARPAAIKARVFTG